MQLIMKKPDFQNCCFTKQPLLILILIPFIMGCNQQAEVGVSGSDTDDAEPLRGVWELTDHYWVKDGDTLLVAPDELEVKHKIYLDGYVIWSEDPITDSLEWHGYGTYRLQDHTLTEKVISTSFPMQAEMGASDEIIYQIDFRNGVIKQSTERMHRGTIYLSVEEWKKLD